MSNLKKVVLATVMLGLVVMGGFAYFVYTSVFTENTTFNNEEAHIYIPTGARFSEVLEQIRPLIKDDISFEAVANRKGYPANIKPGHYIIKRGMSNNDIINTIRSTNIPIRVKFNNQERLENLAGHLAKHMELF